MIVCDENEVAHKPLVNVGSENIVKQLHELRATTSPTGEEVEHPRFLPAKVVKGDSFTIAVIHLEVSKVVALVGSHWFKVRASIHFTRAVFTDFF